MSRFPLHLGSYRTLADGVASFLLAGDRPDPLSPWPAEVLVASGGVAEAITRSLAGKTGGGLAGLHLSTFESLTRRLLDAAGSHPRIANDAERRLAMRAAVRAIDDPLTTSRGIAAMAERSYRDIRDSGLTLADFRSRAARAALRDRQRTTVLCRIFEEYERRIAAMHAIDPADALAAAARGARAASPLIVAGFYDMTGAQLALIEALAAAGRIVGCWVPASEEPADRYAMPLIGRLIAAGGVHSDRSAAHLSFRSPQFTIVEEERHDAEIAGVCSRVAALLATGVAPAAIGITARALDAATVDRLQHWSERYGFDLAEHRTTPLPAQRCGRIATTLLRLRERNFPRAEVLDLLRDGLQIGLHPDIEALEKRARHRRILGGSSAELQTLVERDPGLSGYATVLQHMETLADDGPARGSDWADRLEAIASRLTIESEADLAAAACLDEVGLLFRRAGSAGDLFDAASVLDALEQCSIDSGRPAPQRVWCGDIMRFRGRTFDHLFVVGMQEDVFPQRRTEDPLIPDRDRERTGVRAIGDGRDEERFLFQLLLDGGRTVHFSFSGTDGFGKLLRPSQLLKNFAIEQMPDRRHELLRDFGVAFRSRKQADRPAAAHQARKRPLQLLQGTGRNGPFDGFIGGAAFAPIFRTALSALTPTRLEHFGECPQRYLFRDILGVTDFDDPRAEVQLRPLEKGGIDHDILERFHGALTAEDRGQIQTTLPLLPERLQLLLDTTIDDVFAEHEDDRPSSNPNVRAMEVRATKRNLRNFLAIDFTDLFAQELQPLYFEYGFGPGADRHGKRIDHAEAFVLEAARVPLSIEGRIDRIDTDGTRTRFRVVDYKSGKALKHENLEQKIDRGLRLQLALYAMAVARFFGLPPEAVSGVIKPIAANSTRKFAFSLADKIDRLSATLDLFGASIQAGRFPAFPEKDSCKYCEVRQSCRTRHDLAESRALAQHKEPRTILEKLAEAP